MPETGAFYPIDLPTVRRTRLQNAFKRAIQPIEKADPTKATRILYRGQYHKVIQRRQALPDNFMAYPSGSSYHYIYKYVIETPNITVNYPEPSIRWQNRHTIINSWECTRWV